MSNHTHAYSSYISSILNNSPTKAAFSFGHSERFAQPKPRYDLNRNLEPNRSISPIGALRPIHTRQNVSALPSNKNNLPKNTSVSEWRERDSPKREYGTPMHTAQLVRKLTDRQTDRSYGNRHPKFSPERILKDSKQTGLKMSKDKYQSPSRKLQHTNSKKQTIQPHSDQKAYKQSYGKIWNRDRPETSPKRVASPQRMPSPQRVRARTPVLRQLEEMDDPYKKMTPSGYYPVNMEMNRTHIPFAVYRNPQTYSFGSKLGKRDSSPHLFGPAQYNVASDQIGLYFDSRNKNSDAMRFAKAPRQTPMKPSYLGPGLYPVFSQFGQQN